MNNLLEERLTLLANCFIKCDFNDLFPYLAKDVVWESNWVMQPRVGYDVVVNYYKTKAKQFKTSSWHTYHTLVKTLEPKLSGLNSKNGRVMLYHEKDILLDYVKQISDKGEISYSIIELKLNEEGLITRIDMCMPELFSFEKYKVINSNLN